MKTTNQFIIILFAAIASINVYAKAPSCIVEQYKNDTLHEDGVSVDAPDIAENGSVISIGIDNVAGIPTGEHVKELSFYNEFRTDPVATFVIGQHIKASSIKTRVRLRESSNIYAVAVLSNGDVITGQKYVKVTLGGCGGGSSVGAVSNSERVCTVK